MSSVRRNSNVRSESTRATVDDARPRRLTPISSFVLVFLLATNAILVSSWMLLDGRGAYEYADADDVVGVDWPVVPVGPGGETPDGPPERLAAVDQPEFAYRAYRRDGVYRYEDGRRHPWSWRVSVWTSGWPVTCIRRIDRYTNERSFGHQRDAYVSSMEIRWVAVVGLSCAVASLALVGARVIGWSRRRWLVGSRPTPPNAATRSAQPAVRRAGRSMKLVCIAALLASTGQLVLSIRSFGWRDRVESVQRTLTEDAAWPGWAWRIGDEMPPLLYRERAAVGTLRFTRWEPDTFMLAPGASPWGPAFALEAGWPLPVLREQNLWFADGGDPEPHDGDKRCVIMWPHLLATPTVAGTVAAFLLAVPGVRRGRRRRRGLCPMCTYPRGSADTCAECGYVHGMPIESGTTDD